MGHELEPEAHMAAVPTLFVHVGSKSAQLTLIAARVATANKSHSTDTKQRICIRRLRHLTYFTATSSTRRRVNAI